MSQRKFKTIGDTEQYSVIFGSKRETVRDASGEVNVHYREVPRVRLSQSPTLVSDEQADALKDHRAYGTAFAEVTGAQEQAETAAAEKTEPGATSAARALAEEEGVALDDVDGSGKDGKVLKGDVERALQEGETGEGDELTANESVTDVNSAVSFLASHGVEAEDLQDKNDNLNTGKIVAAAKEIGYRFPNFG
jgi:pyruvate/2-oxoglutarate dehydrogenase complex dihydrolipoamide acyltransferase (E2) component